MGITTSVVVYRPAHGRIGRLIDRFLHQFSIGSNRRVPVGTHLLIRRLLPLVLLKLLMLVLLLLLLLPVLGRVLVKVGHLERLRYLLVRHDFTLLHDGYVLGRFRLDVGRRVYDRSGPR